MEAPVEGVCCGIAGWGGLLVMGPVGGGPAVGSPVLGSAGELLAMRSAGEPPAMRSAGEPSYGSRGHRAKNLLDFLNDCVYNYIYDGEVNLHPGMICNYICDGEVAERLKYAGLKTL